MAIIGNLIFSSFLLAFVVWALIITFDYPFRARVFPQIALFSSLIFIIVQIFKDIFKLTKDSLIDIRTNNEEPKVSPSRYLTIWGWIVGLLLMLWLLGFIATVMLIPFLYLILNKESWIISVIISLSCLIFFYIFFGMALGLPLYSGLLYLKFLD